jgi:hypothetical protein
MQKSSSLKKKLSVDLNRAVESVLKEYYGLFKVKSTQEFVVCFYDPIESDIFFEISKEIFDTSNGHVIDYLCKPFNKKIIEARPAKVKIDQFLKEVGNWLNNLKYYSEDSILDDAIYKSYLDEFYDDFKIQEKDADITPLIKINN